VRNEISYQGEMEKNKHNLRKTWQTINQVINRRKVKKQKIDSISIGGQLSTDPQEIADFFNNYFSNIGTTLDKKIPVNNKDPTSYIPSNSNASIFLRPCTKEELLKYITNLRNCAAGWDQVPSSLLQENQLVIAECLVHIINLSLIQGIFPNELKVAILVPIYKAGTKSDTGNYRPISLLSTFSKNFERVMFTRLSNYFKKHKLLYELQFGFRESYSTQMAIITLMDRIIGALERGNYLVGIFLDFSKAFDTVNHTILLSKLYKYGIRGIAHD
jgi:hypothetical protein